MRGSRCVTVMDGDLQDPPEVIPQFVQLWREGNDVVYAVRQKAKERCGWEQLGYFTFYRLLRAISDIEIPLDSGDFCLMDRRVVEALRDLPERARFVRGLRTFVGFRQVGLAYKREARGAGQPKYSILALVRLAIDGLVSFSSYPLRLGTTYLGVATAAISGLLLIWVLVDALVNHTAPRGWASVLGTVLFMGSVQLISLGIMGEYIRLIFVEIKQHVRLTSSTHTKSPPTISPVAGPVQTNLRRTTKTRPLGDHNMVRGRCRREHGRGHIGRPRPLDPPPSLVVGSAAD